MTDQQYYQNESNWGSYQYISLTDIVNNFMLMNVGDDQLVNNVPRYKVLFYAKEAIKELNYDSAKEVKALEYIVGDDLRMVLPHDYVNYVRLSLQVEGVLFPMSENLSQISARAYVQDSNNDLTFDINGNVITGQSQLDLRRLEQSTYQGPGIYNGCQGWCVDGDWYFGYQIGGRYGLDTSRANSNPTFRINKKAGVINFASNIAGQRVVLEYITDGLEEGDAGTHVNKLAEKFVYAYISWCILDSKIGIQEYIVRRAQTKKSALLRNLSIRTSPIHSSQLLMVMRGKDKTIK
jgi:hypothetical protein